jgi:3-dehydroquinate dehydratase
MDEIVKIENIQNRIFTIRGLQVMIDRDLAELYNVSTKRLNEQVKRNVKRFPESFRFQLSDKEKKELVANCDRFEKLKHSSVNPYAFTEQGVAMLSAVLHSDIAIEVSIQIMEAFSQMRKFILSNANLFQRLENIEKKQVITDEKFDRIFKALEDRSLPPKQGIFYNGQIFDAYTLIADIIRFAKKSIILIDNYVDDTVLKQLAKRGEKVTATIFTKTINEILKQDIDKHNKQYPKIELRKLNTAHDRFLIIDKKTVYHFGASLKDAGKKWFAFSKLEMDAEDIISKL